MKREQPEEKWKRITGLAREAPPGEAGNDAPHMPPGLATRVAANWSSAKPTRPATITLLERSAWWGAGFTALACVAWVALAQPVVDDPEPVALDSLLFAPEASRGGGGLLF